jgi:hypothetical protein
MDLFLLHLIIQCKKDKKKSEKNNIERIENLQKTNIITKSKLNSKESINDDKSKRNKVELIKVSEITNITSKRKSNWKEFEEILKKENIKKLYHFTDESNLKSIIKNKGLYSWSSCEKLKIDVNCYGGDKLSRDLDEYHGLEDYARLSFVKNHPMEYIAKKDGRIVDPVRLEIDPSVIYLKDTMFSNMNATKTGNKNGGSLDIFKKIKFEIIKKTNHCYNLEDYEKPYFQAEVMIKENLPLKYILNIDELLNHKKSLNSRDYDERNYDTLKKEEFNEEECNAIEWDIEYKNKINIK